MLIMLGKVLEKISRPLPKIIYNITGLHKSFDVNNAWESIGENIKTSAKDNL
jgi:hypothetical protein